MVYSLLYCLLTCNPQLRQHYYQCHPRCCHLNAESFWWWQCIISNKPPTHTHTHAHSSSLTHLLALFWFSVNTAQHSTNLTNWQREAQKIIRDESGSSEKGMNEQLPDFTTVAFVVPGFIAGSHSLRLSPHLPSSCCPICLPYFPRLSCALWFFSSVC